MVKLSIFNQSDQHWDEALSVSIIYLCDPTAKFSTASGGFDVNWLIFNDLSSKEIPRGLIIAKDIECQSLNSATYSSLTLPAVR